MNSHSDPVGAETLDLISRADRLNSWTFETIAPFLKGHVLEIGSGIGNISRFILDAGFFTTLSDYNPDYCHELKHRFREHPSLAQIVSLDLQKKDFMTAYSSLGKRFDCIVMSNVIEHLGDDALALEICHFLLKQHGHLIILAPSYRQLYCRLDRELGHYRRYTVKELKEKSAGIGFTMVSSSYFNFLGLAGWLVSGKMLKHKQLRGGEMKLYNRLVPFARLLDRIMNRKAGLSCIVVVKRK